MRGWAAMANAVPKPAEVAANAATAPSWRPRGQAASATTAVSPASPPRLPARSARLERGIA
jgi:hypothetical protein